MTQIIAIATGGAIGAVLRYLIAGRVQAGFVVSGFPMGTLAVNVIGSLLLGALYVLFTDRLQVSDELRLGLTVGVLGAFTTFSTFSLEAVQLVEQGRLATALAFVLTSVLICILAAWLGMLAVRQF